MSKHFNAVQLAIVEASKKLNVAPDTSGNAEQLAARLAGLNAQLEYAPPAIEAAAEAAAEAAKASETPVTDAVAAVVEVKEPYFAVGPGLAVTSLRGILAEGAVVTERDFINAESFRTLLDSKTVVEYK